MPKQLKEEIVVQSNELLEAPLFRTSLQLKIFSKIIIAIRENSNKDIYSFQIKDLLDDLELGLDNYSYLKQECKKMFRVLDLTERSKNLLHLTVLFTDIAVNQKGVIDFKVNQDLKPLILELSNGKYTKYYFKNIARLNSNYAIRIYELLKQYETIGYRIINLDNLKYYLAKDGSIYTRYNDFKRYVILISEKELKEKTDIYFSFEEIKTGRKITAIRFNIFPNKIVKQLHIKQQNKPEIESTQKKHEINLEEQKVEPYNKLVMYGVNKAKALQLCKEYSIEDLAGSIKYVEDEIEKGKEKSNLAGFVIASIKNGYHSNSTELLEKERIANKRKEVRNREEEENRKRKTEEQKSALSKKFGMEERKNYLYSLSEEERNLLLIKLKSKYKDNPVILSMIKDINSNLLISDINNLIPDFKQREKQYIKENM